MVELSVVFEKKGSLTEGESLDFFLINFQNGDILTSVYKRLHAEGLYRGVFGGSSLLSFIATVLKVNAVTYMPIIRGPNGELKECCGLLWIEKTHDLPRTGRCHFLFFRRFWGRISKDVTKMCLCDAFDAQGFALLLAIMSVKQKLVLNSARKLGFSDVGILPKSMMFLGEITDAVILYLHKEDFNG